MVPLAQRLEGLGVLDTALLGNSMVTDGQNSIWYTCIKSQGPTALYRFDWSSRRTQAMLPNLAYGTASPHLGQFHDPFLLPDSLLFLQRYFGPSILYNMRDGSTIELPFWKASTL